VRAMPGLGLLIEVAVVNGPASVVVSGDVAVMDELLARCESEGIRARRVRGVDGAGHSSHMEGLYEPMLKAFGQVSPRSSRVPFYSTVTGGLLDTAELDAAYWWRNLRQRVRFDPAVRAAVRDGHEAFVEASSHPVLVTSVQDVLVDCGARSAVAVGTLRRQEGGARRFLASLAELRVRGVPVDFGPVVPGGSRPVELSADLPTYAFQHRWYWLDASWAATTVPGPSDAPSPDPEQGVTEAADELAGRLAGADRAGREEILLGLVRHEAAVILGHASADSVEPDALFFDIGFESLTAVELRHHLSALTRLELPVTFAFDHPTARLAAEQLRISLDDAEAAPEPQKD
jgi:acyl transferase domain-containing protein